MSDWSNIWQGIGLLGQTKKGSYDPLRQAVGGGLGRISDTIGRMGDKRFQAGEAKKQREWQTGERVAGEDYEANQAVLDRALEREKMGMTLEIELGVTGGEEDGVDNTGIDNARLYTQPEHVALAYKTLLNVSPDFTIAASFGNVHGVYKPGNVHLQPKILKNSQDYIQKKLNTAAKPVNFVFHGGSGSAQEEIREAISYGVIKMNIDTDTQWAYWSGIMKYYKKNEAYLQGQIGNPEGEDKPNKKYYDPRAWLRDGEKTLVERLKIAFEDLNCLNRY